MNKKLKYGITLIILTSIATNQNIDATSLWQRIKDIAQYRWASTLGSLGFGYAAYTAEDPKYKILAGLCSAGLARYACTTAPDTSTLEGLITLAAYNISYNSNRMINIVHGFLIKNDLLKNMRENSSSQNQQLQNQINALGQFITKKINEIDEKLLENNKYRKQKNTNKPNENGTKKFVLNEEGEKESLNRVKTLFDNIINNPLSIKQDPLFQQELKEISKQSR